LISTPAGENSLSDPVKFGQRQQVPAAAGGDLEMNGRT
jgi:hypothetical protein